MSSMEYEQKIIKFYSLRLPIDEINMDNEVVLTKVIADMVERHFLRGMICIAGQWSCEYCISQGVTRVGGMHWPYERTAHFPERTHSQWSDIAWYVCNKKLNYVKLVYNHCFF